MRSATRASRKSRAERSCRPRRPRTSSRRAGPVSARIVNSPSSIALRRALEPQKAVPSCRIPSGEIVVIFVIGKAALLGEDAPMTQACFRVIAPSVSSGPRDEKQSAALRDLRDDGAGHLGGGRRPADVEGAHIAAAEDLVDSALQLRRGLLVAVLAVPVPEPFEHHRE